MEQQFQDAKWLRANESIYQYEIASNTAWWLVARDSHTKVIGYSTASQAFVQDFRKPPFIGRRHDRGRSCSGLASEWGLYSDTYILPSYQRHGIGRAFFYFNTLAMIDYSYKHAYTYVATDNNAHGFCAYGRPYKVATGLRAKPGQISDHGGFRLPYDYYVWHDLQYTVADCRAAMLKLECPKPPESIPRQYVIPLGSDRASR